MNDSVEQAELENFEFHDEPPTVMAGVVRGAIVVMVLVIGGGISFYLKNTKHEPEKTSGPKRQVRLQVFEPKKMTLSRQWVGQATTRPLNSANVPSRVVAVVAEVAQGVEAGQAVRAGQLLVRLESDDYQRQLDIAERDLAEAAAHLVQLDVERKTLEQRIVLRSADVAILEKDLKRYETLKANDATTLSEVDATRRNLINAQILLAQIDQNLKLMPQRRIRLEAMMGRLEATVSLAKLNVDRCRILSPIDGILQMVDVEVGESLAAGQRVARVVQLGLIEIPVQLPASVRKELSVGAMASIDVSGKQWSAKVVRIAPELDPATRTFTAFAVVDQSEDQTKAAGLMPGAYVRVVVTSSSAHQRWVVPRRSVSAGRIMVVRQGEVKSIPVKVEYGRGGNFKELGLPDRQWAVLVPGVNLSGEQVVVNATRSLSDGQMVKPVMVIDQEANR